MNLYVGDGRVERVGGQVVLVAKETIRFQEPKSGCPGQILLV